MTALSTPNLATLAYVDVERVAMALFDTYDSPTGVDWYRDRRRLFRRAYELLDAYDRNVEAVLRTIKERSVAI